MPSPTTSNQVPQFLSMDREKKNGKQGPQKKFFFSLYEWYYISICWVAQIRNIITINWVHFKFVNLLSKPFFPLWIRLWDMSVSSTVIHQSLNGICYWYGVMGFYSYDHFLVYSTVRAIYVASSMLFSLQLLFIEYLHVWSLSQKDEHLFQGEERNINAYWPTYHFNHFYSFSYKNNTNPFQIFTVQTLHYWLKEVTDYSCEYWVIKNLSWYSTSAFYSESTIFTKFNYFLG